MSVALHFIPADCLLRITSFLSVRDLGRLSRTCTQVLRLYSEMISAFEERAALEQRRMRITFRAVPLTIEEVLGCWGALTYDERKALKADLQEQPPIFYSGLFDSAFIIFSGAAMDACDMMMQMEEMISTETEIRKAFILAKSFLYRTVRDRFLGMVAQRADCPIQTALEIAYQSSDRLDRRSNTLAQIALRDGHMPEIALEIALGIKDEDIKRATLDKIATRHGMDLESWLTMRKKNTT